MKVRKNESKRDVGGKCLQDWKQLGIVRNQNVAFLKNLAIQQLKVNK